MSLEAIKRVTEIESRVQERKAAAESEARQILANAERVGLDCLQQARAAAVEAGKEQLKQAEERAAKRAAEVQRVAEAECAVLRETAAQNLEEAAEFIVGRVVKH